MSKYRLFNLSIKQAKSAVVDNSVNQPGSNQNTEGNYYVAATLENQDCVFEENTSLVMFGVNGLINAIRPFLDADHGGTSATNREDEIDPKYRFLNGIFVRQKLMHGMSYLLDSNNSPRVDKHTHQPITMDSVNVFCILVSEQPKPDGTPYYAKNWDPVSRVASIERQFFRPVQNTVASAATTVVPQPAPDPLAVATQPQPQVQQPAPQPAPQVSAEQTAPVTF